MWDSNTIQTHLDQIKAILSGIPDPAERSVACVRTWALLHKTIIEIGPSGMRGLALREAKIRLGDWNQVAAEVARHGGADASPTSVRRVAEKYVA